jgi:hypothetical protein
MITLGTPTGKAYFYTVRYSGVAYHTVQFTIHTLYSVVYCNEYVVFYTLYMYMAYFIFQMVPWIIYLKKTENEHEH